jgi:alginate O-acetyltransferase complex protein AlgF
MQAFAGGDAALYGPTAPKGSTFVRVYNASSASQRHRRQHQIKQVGAQASSDFSFMPGGDYSAKVGSQTVPVKLAGDTTTPWSTTPAATRN